MSTQKKSKKLLIMTTMLTILALTSLLAVYAATIKSLQSDTVTIVSTANAYVRYNQTNVEDATWVAAPTFNSTDDWYARLELDAGVFIGQVTITWQLQKNSTGAWEDVSSPVTTTITLDGAHVHVYASDDGLITSNHNWKDDLTGTGNYRLNVIISS